MRTPAPHLEPQHRVLEPVPSLETHLEELVSEDLIEWGHGTIGLIRHKNIVGLTKSIFQICLLSIFQVDNSVRNRILNKA